MEKLYTTKKEYLVDFLEDCHQFIQKSIKGKWELIDCKENKNEEAVKEILPWQPNNYEQFAIQRSYMQVFESTNGFIANLSILDWLFCAGGKEISKQLSEPLK